MPERVMLDVEVEELDREEAEAPGACCESGVHSFEVKPNYRLTMPDGGVLDVCASCLGVFTSADWRVGPGRVLRIRR